MVHINRDAVNHVISVTGTDGSPQPETWKIVIEDPRDARRCARDRGRRTAGSFPIGPSSVGGWISGRRDDQDVALEPRFERGVSRGESHRRQIAHAFRLASYTLRTDEHGDPIWIVTLHEVNGQPVGTIHIGANRGNVTRTEGMFAGTTNDVATSSNVYRERRHHDEEVGKTWQMAIIVTMAEERRGCADIFHAQRRTKPAVCFDRVRQSFADSIEPLKLNLTMFDVTLAI